MIGYQGFDDAFIGFGQRCGCDPIAVYDMQKMAMILVADGMTYDEAIEYIDFNCLSGWIGEQTPLIITPPGWAQDD